MKNKLVILIIAGSLLIYFAMALWMDHNINEEIEKLNGEIEFINDQVKQDSVMLSEYQEALSIFTMSNPKAAEEFVQIMENLNTEK